MRLLESVMAERIGTKAFIHQLALRMQTDDTVAAAWLEATVATLYLPFRTPSDGDPRIFPGGILARTAKPNSGMLSIS